MTPRLLRNWWVEHCQAQAFQPPELRDHFHLAGTVTSHHGGARTILTGRVMSTAGRLVTTRSGSVYELGEPSPAYLDWLREHGKTLDEAQPVKVPNVT